MSHRANEPLPFLKAERAINLEARARETVTKAPFLSFLNILFSLSNKTLRTKQTTQHANSQDK
jgi:hypothetical protein